MKCPKCDGEMEQGILLDAGSWGTPLFKELEWMKGKKLSVLGNVEGIQIKSYRCKKCGFLENYAK